MSNASPQASGASKTASHREDAAALIGASDLPEPIASLIGRVVRSTRLWKREQSEVTQELIAHFADGLDSGASADDLVRSFGDPKAAARLIRRAMKRKRPLAWRAFATAVRGTATVMACVLALFLLTYAVLFVRYHTGRPQIKRNFTEDINAPVRALAAEERAWPIYVEAIRALEYRPEHTQTRFYGGDTWEEAAVFAKSRADALELIRRAASRAHLGYEVGPTPEPALREVLSARGEPQGVNPFSNDPNPPLYALQLPYLSELRKMGLLLSVDARAAAREEDGARAAADVHAMLGLAEHARAVPVLISDLVSVAILERTLLTVRELLAETPNVLDDEMLRDLSHRLGSFPRDGGAFVRVGGERRYIEDLFQRIYTDDGHGDGRITREGIRNLELMTSGTDVPGGGSLMGPLAGGIVAGRKEMRRKFDELWAIMETESQTPLWLRDGMDSSDSAVEQLRASRFASWRYLPAVLLIPSLGRAAVSGELARMSRDATLACIGVELFRRREGRLPASLEELVPSILPTIPLDRFTGEPLRYVRDGAAYRLYGVGADLDDDGGRWPVLYVEVETESGERVIEEQPDESGARKFRGRSAVDEARRAAAAGQPTGWQPADGDILYWPASTDFDQRSRRGRSEHGALAAPAFQTN